MYYRLIISVISILAVLFIYEPMIFFITILLLGIGWILISQNVMPAVDKANSYSDREYRRKMALRIAKIYLLPYKSIWKDLKLANKYCSLELGSDGVSISGKECVHPYRRFKVLLSQVHEYTDLWNMFCKNFSHNKTYDDLVENCRLYKLTIYEYQAKPEEISSKLAQPDSIKPKVEKLDINNCSEIELTALPGISIVMAKKAVKKREEIGGFKTIDDFFLYMKLKSHMEQQLRDLICVKKMNGTLKKIDRSSERSVDL